MPRVRTKAKLNFAKREYGGEQSRFRLVPATEPVPRDQASLPPSHPALIEGRTLFPSRVFDAGDRDRILVRGYHNSKIGDLITKGPWAGFRIFTFALEERATCPRSCAVWSACYGNALHMSVRFRFNAGFLMSLEEELVAMGDRYPGGFAVRAHVLGDFPTLEYVQHWRMWLDLVPALHVWGYTAHLAGTPIGDAVISLNRLYPGRWAFRQSVAPDAEPRDWQAATTWTSPERIGPRSYRAAGGIVCPAETGATSTCGTCAICFSPEAARKRIVFLGHGTRPGIGVGGRRPNKSDAKYSGSNPEIRKAPPVLPSERFTDVDAFIASRGVTRLPAAKAQGVR